MRKITGVLAMMSVVMLVMAVQVKAEGIKEGKWSMTMTTKMEGMDQEATQAMQEMENMSPEEKAMMEKMMGGMKMQMGAGGMGMTTTVSQCITNDNPVPENESDEDCQTTHSIDGNTVNFESICSDSKSTGSVTYEEESMHGTIRSQGTADGNTESVTIEINGQYEGPCS